MITQASIENLASKAYEQYTNEGLSLTASVLKVAMDYGMSDNLIKEVCGRLNHMEFKNKFAEDNLVVFDIAKYKDVIGLMGSNDKTATLITAEDDIIVVDKIAKEIPQEDDRKLWEEDKKRVEAANLTEAGEKNMDIINSLIIKRDDVNTGLYNQVKTLYQSGTNLNEIYSTLNESWGKGNTKVTAEAFKEIVDQLKSEGYVSKDSDVDLEHPQDLSDMDIIENGITKKAEELININDELARHKYAHFLIISGLSAYGAQRNIDSLNSRILGNGIKEKTGSENQGVAKTAQIFTPAIRSKIVEGLTAAALIATASSAAYLGQKGMVSAKSPGVKKQILAKYPDLQKVDTQLFDDLFQTFVGMDPKLLDMPFALASLIRKHSEYGVIDTSTIKAISSASVPNPLESMEKQLSSIAPKLALGILGQKSDEDQAERASQGNLTDGYKLNYGFNNIPAGK